MNATQPSEEARSRELLAVWRWSVIENIVTIICTLLGCWLVSGWCALLMLNINYHKRVITSPLTDHTKESSHE